MCLCLPVLGKQKREDAWGSLAIQSSLIVELQADGRSVSKVPFQRITPEVYMHTNSQMENLSLCHSGPHSTIPNSKMAAWESTL